MRRFAYWLFPLIAVSVAAFIVMFMFQINAASPESSGEAEMQIQQRTKTTPDESVGWLERFSLGEDKGYMYPVNELTLKLDTPNVPESPTH